MKKTFAKRHLGQNFLIDPNIHDKIINTCQLNKTDYVLEIGPGKGAITGLLATRAQKIIAVEKDADLITVLKEKFEGQNIEIIHQDILTFNFKDLPQPLVVVGNLPYNIASPIIEKVIAHKNLFQSFYFMVQLEFAQRLIAQPSTKTYGSLSCFIQYHSKPQLLFKIKPGAFRPIPKVQSAFMKMTFKDSNAQSLVKSEQELFQLIRTAFHQRRKKLVNVLDGLIKKERLIEILKKKGINENSRAENLSLEDYIDICNQMNSA